MILDKKETAVSYRCPECGAAVTSIVGIFTLTADMIRLKCPCGGSELEIVYTKDKKVRLSVPCFLCPTPHNYLISSQMFFEKDLFAFPCHYSGFDICYIGKQENVSKAMAKSEKELRELLGETDFSTVSQRRGEKRELSDPQVQEVITFVIHDLAEEGKILCDCPDGGEYDVEILEDHINVRCKQCGGHVSIPTNSVTAANDFLAIDELILK